MPRETVQAIIKRIVEKRRDAEINKQQAALRSGPLPTRMNTSEIKLRACIRIGELSIELEREEQSRGGSRHPASGKPTKTDTLADAGLSTSTANRYEDLTGRCSTS